MCLRQFVMIVTAKWVTVLLKRFPEFLWWNTSVSSHLLVYLCSISSVEIRLQGYYYFLSNWWHWSTIHYKRNAIRYCFFLSLFVFKLLIRNLECLQLVVGLWNPLNLAIGCNIWRDQKLVWQSARFKVTRFLPVLPASARYAMIKAFDRTYFE